VRSVERRVRMTKPKDHSPEPWSVKETHIAGQLAWEILSKDNSFIVEGIDLKETRRIVACVNACQGIPTERLEKIKCCNDPIASYTILASLLHEYDNDAEEDL